MYTTKGRKFIKNGKEIVFQGYNLGNWLMLERFMFGFPGVDQLFRRYFREYAGEERYHDFFDYYYKIYFTREDARYLADLGCNILRIPFNYRVFESDMRPYQFSEEPFGHMDRVIELCAQEGIGCVIDYHAAQGYENHAHCSDNITGVAGLYRDALCQERFIALWEYVAEHYKDNENVIGYDLLNEPAPEEDDVEALKHLYRKVIPRIRTIDKTHILFIEGKDFSNDFEDFDELFDDNMAHSPHYYVGGADYFRPMTDAQMRAIVERDMDIRCHMSEKLCIPCWIGETGLSLGPNDDKKLLYVNHTLDVLNERGISWTLWTYKDLYRMGILSTKDDCQWRKSTKKFIELKRKYKLDVSRWEPWEYTDRLTEELEKDFPPEVMESHGGLKARLWNSIINSIGQTLAQDYGKAFADFTQDHLYQMANSFMFQNCVVKKEWEEVVKAHLPFAPGGERR